MKKLKKILLLGFMLVCYIAIGQQFNLEQIGKADLLTISGGVAANTVFYEGAANRDPFNYFVNGNVNLNISGLYNLPFSFIYSNRRFDAPSPFKFNRLSLHPSYKWITAHIGDVGMTFSPYTVSGHQFSGFGVDLTPNGPFTISALYGRFLKAAEYNADYPEALPAYKRMGYGLKTTYELEKLKVGLIFFSAKDDANTLEEPVPAELDVRPKANTALSAETGFTLFDKARFRIEYATSAVTEDTRTQVEENRGFLAFLGEENVSTEYYHALKVALDYPAGNGSLGAGYERVDPGYRTFGAYFFNNDLENITVNASQQLFNNKLGIRLNAGLQRDDLDRTKSSQMQRIVTSVNLDYRPSEKLTFTGAYSNFQSYTNIRNQFDYINEVSEFDTVDTLNYRQISQNANLGLNYFLKKTKERQHSLHLNLSLQNAENQQDGQTLEASSSVFYNSAASYTMGYPERALSVSIAVNATQNTLAENNSFTLGPTLVINKQFLDKKLRTGFSGSYNTSFSGGEQQANVYNFRCNGSYVVAERHQFMLNLLSLFRSGNAVKTNDLTATFGYSYSFDALSFRLKKKDKTPGKKQANLPAGTSGAAIVPFRYRGVIYKGTPAEVIRQLYRLQESAFFKALPDPEKETLKRLLENVAIQPQKPLYKEKALNFLDAYYEAEDFLTWYNEAIYTVLRKLRARAGETGLRLEKRYAEAKAALDSLERLKSTPKEEKFEEKRASLRAERELALRNVLVHRWREAQLAPYTAPGRMDEPGPVLKAFKEARWKAVRELYKKEAGTEAVASYLEAQLIDFYGEAAPPSITSENFEFRYFKTPGQ